MDFKEIVSTHGMMNLVRADKNDVTGDTEAMVWISKREIAYYIILRKAFGNKPFNLGEALDILSLFGSKNVGRKTLKKLVKKGFLEKTGVIDYNIVELEKAFEKLLQNYMMQRLYRNLKSRGYSVVIDLKNSSIVIECDQVIENIVAKLSAAGISAKCKQNN
ncbi:MAG: hypothetical protein QXT53_00370 [Ignisphaera sp.]